MNSKEKKQGGFTLAELLVVVAIIAILVAVSIPIFSGQLEKSRNSVDLSNAKSIANAITYYYIANPDKLSELSSVCDVAGGKHNVQVSVAGKNMAIANVLRPALKQAGLIEKYDNNTAARYTEITCKSKKKWEGYRVVITTYPSSVENPGDFVIYYWGIADEGNVHKSNSLDQYQNGIDPTGFKDAMKGK